MAVYFIQLEDTSQVDALKQKVEVISVNDHLMAVVEATPDEIREKLGDAFDVIAVG
ncbi:hypothetical protein [Alicyclobacillus shizuokensis]|uniref:hypothetical protein n=1 Tax=Alicyclobacillus shizuokensis TaxID=392014 RepID=UPI000A97B741|nr:hypothetical protein [Alicyclobacillus shizuokensis]